MTKFQSETAEEIGMHSCDFEKSCLRYVGRYNRVERDDTGGSTLKRLQHANFSYVQSSLNNGHFLLAHANGDLTGKDKVQIASPVSLPEQ